MIGAAAVGPQDHGLRDGVDVGARRARRAGRRRDRRVSRAQAPRRRDSRRGRSARRATRDARGALAGGRHLRLRRRAGRQRGDRARRDPPDARRGRAVAERRGDARALPRHAPGRRAADASSRSSAAPLPKDFSATAGARDPRDLRARTERRRGRAAGGRRARRPRLRRLVERAAAPALRAARDRLRVSVRAEHLLRPPRSQRGKPSPDLFLFAARAMRAAPQECLVIEDSVAGVTAARAPA